MTDEWGTRRRAFAQEILANLGNTEPTEAHLLKCMDLLEPPADWVPGGSNEETGVREITVYDAEVQYFPSTSSEHSDYPEPQYLAPISDYGVDYILRLMPDGSIQWRKP